MSEEGHEEPETVATYSVPADGTLEEVLEQAFQDLDDAEAADSDGGK